MLSSKRSTRWILATTGILLAGSVLTAVRAVDESAGPRVGIVEKTDQHPFEFEVVGLAPALVQALKELEPNDPAFTKLFSVTVAGEPGGAVIPPVSGQYRVDGSRLVFSPRYPPRGGLTYRAVFQGDASSPGDKSVSRIARAFAIPKAKEDANRTPAQVRQIYPTGDVLPENHLRFYIHFSRPMARAAAYQNLELLDEKGQLVEAAFLELGEELWDPTGQRFTLLLDPGRIKRGLKPREEDGPILEAGKQYTLVVKRDWRDALGQSLKADFRKTFQAGPPRDKPLDVADWKVKAPQAGSDRLLSVEFPYPLDHALLARLLRVVDAAGQQVEGRSIVCNAERKWTFAASAPWQPGRYQLVVDTVLEDSAGNRIGRAFEVDQVESVTRKLVPEYVNIAFEVRSDNTAAVVP